MQSAQFWTTRVLRQSTISFYSLDLPIFRMFTLLNGPGNQTPPRVCHQEAHTFQGAPTEQNKIPWEYVSWGTLSLLENQGGPSQGSSLLRRRKGQMNRVLWECLSWPLHPCCRFMRTSRGKSLTQESPLPFVGSQDSQARLEQP